MAAKTIQSTVAFQDPQGNVVVSGSLTFDLSQPAVITSGGGEVAPTRVDVFLTTAGLIPNSTVLWANDQLTPSGTTYRMRLYNSNGLLIADFGAQSIIGSSPIDISQLTPVSSSGGTVSYPAPVLLNPSAPQTITGQSLTLTSTAPFITQGTGTHSGTETFSGAAQFESGRPWIDVTGTPYNADPTGVADSTTAIQNAHNAAVAFAVGPAAVFFPYGTYKFTSLTWSPYVPAIADSRVILTTALASGNAISISDQYGKPTPDPNSNGTTRSKTFTGNFQVINTNGSTTAVAFLIGGATSANFASQLELNGLGVSGFKGGVFKFGYNAFLIHITNFFGEINGASYFSVLAGATGTGEGIAVDSSTFAEGISNPTPAFLFSWNTSNASDLDFHNCSYDYLSGVNDTAQAAVNTSVNMTNSHFEWNETTAPYISVTGGISFKIVNAKFFTPLTSGFFSPFVGKVNGTSVLNITNARYEFGGTVALLYDNASNNASSLLTLDPFVNTANPVTTYFTQTGGVNARAAFNAVPVNGALAYDMSNYNLGVGNLYIGGNSGASNIAQIASNNAGIIAGVTASNLYVLRAGVAGLAAQDNSGNIGIAGNYFATGKPFVTSTYTNATTTPSNIPGLSVAVAANTNYTIIFHLYYQGSASTAGLDITVTGPASPTSVIYAYEEHNALATVVDSVATAFGTKLVGGTITATTNFSALVTIGLRNGANAGTVQLQGSATGAGTVTVQIGSFGIVQ